MTSMSYEALLKRYAEYAPIYDRRWAKYSAATLGHALELANLSGDEAVIDVACGTGLLAEMLRRAHPQLAIVGVDASNDMLDQARARLNGDGLAQWRHGSAESLPVESRQFDLLFCTNAFHLVQNASAALGEFQRVLKPGGRLIIVDWCQDFLSIRLLSILLAFDSQKRTIRRLDELKALIEEHGFELQSISRFKATALWGLMSVEARKPHRDSH